MSQPVRDVCPYALKPLGGCSDLSKEHIFPDAIGGVLDYCIKVDAKKNSDLGTLVDGPLVSSPLIEALRLLHGIKSRSGVPELRMRGNISGTNTPVDITIPASGPIGVRAHKPVEIDRSTGRGRAIFSPDDRDAFLSELAANFARKGKTVIFGHEYSMGGGYDVDLSLDLRALKRGMMKIAYAAIYEYLGDQYLRDPSIPEWHTALFSETDDQAMSARIHGLAFESDLIWTMIPKLQPYEHAVAIARFEEIGPIVAVALFGGEFFHLIARVSETSSYGMDVLDGKIAICDPKAAKTRILDFRDHFVKAAEQPFSILE